MSRPTRPSVPWPTRTSPSVFFARRARLRDQLGAGCDAAALTSGWARPRNFQHNVFPFRPESHFAYLVGLPRGGQALEGALLVLAPEGDTLYVTAPDPEAVLWSGPAPTLDDLERTLEIAVRPLDEFEPRGFVATLPPQDDETATWLGSLLGRTVEAGSGDEVRDGDALLADAMVALRLIHDEAALDQLRQAAQVTQWAHEAGMRSTRVGLRETEVRAAFEAEIIRAGMTCAYHPIVTVRGEVLHNHRHDGVLGDEDLLLADVGAETPEGWAADVTRTWPAGGRYSTTQRELYEVVLRAQEAAIREVRPGVRFLDVHRAAGRAMAQGLVELGILRGSADEALERGAVALFFPHGVGHLLGLDVHDMEDLGDRAGYAPGRVRSERPGDVALRLDRDLCVDMVVTIEPGFYQIPHLLEDPTRTGPVRELVDWSRLERFGDVRGIRIEDDVRVTPEGAEVLTAEIPRQVEAVEACLG